MCRGSMVRYSDPWAEPHIWPQGILSQRSSRSHWSFGCYGWSFYSLFPHTLMYLNGAWTHWYWEESCVRPQQKWGQRSCRGNWPGDCKIRWDQWLEKYLVILEIEKEKNQMKYNWEMLYVYFGPNLGFWWLWIKGFGEL